MAQASYDLSISNITYISAANPSGNTQVQQRSPVTMAAEDERLFFKFSSFPSSLNFKKLLYAELLNDSDNNSGASIARVSAYAAATAFTPSALTWNNKPAGTNGITQYYYYGKLISSANSGTDFDKSVRTKAWIKNGMYFRRASSSENNVKVLNKHFYSESGDWGDAKLRVYYDDGANIASQIQPADSPTSGYVNPSSAQTFKWEYESAEADAVCVGSFTQASAVFHWREGTSGAWTDVTISGSAKQVTIAAGVFPTGKTIQYYISGTDTAGTSSQTSVYTLSTAAGTASATAISPSSSLEDGSASITLRWALSSTDGQQPSRIVGTWRKTSDPDEAGSYSQLFDSSVIFTEFDVPANTFPAGSITWVIQVWNIDGVEGTPDSAEFICVAAPDPVEGLSGTQVPRTTISWQSAEQEAYEISIDGEVVQKAFGPGVYSWQAAEPLEDGDHVISVRVQGVYGFWSQPSFITLNINNSVPAAWSDITLAGTFGTDASLTLDMQGGTVSPPVVQWYRDGKRIAQVQYAETATAGPFPYADRRALGSHQYYAELWSSDGNYARTNIVTGVMHCPAKQIALLDGGEWLTLRLSESGSDAETYQITQQKVSQHVNGAVWPELERSPFRDLSATYDCAFRDPAEASAFEAMFGKIVILKSRGDNVVIGMLSQLQKTVNVFYTSYKFTIQMIHVPDFSEESA